MKLKIYGSCLLLLILAGSCKKYLDARPNHSLVIISSLGDLQALLDSWSAINLTTAGSDEVSTDEYFLPYATYQALALEQQRNMYTWQPANLFQPYTNITNDWTQTYNNVYIANVVLANLPKIERSAANAADWDNVRGQALFLRAYSFYKAVTIWSPAYDAATAGGDLGIPLRLDPDFNQPSVRASVAASYDRITGDLKAAAGLLTVSPLTVYRASKPAAYAMLARVQLARRDYDQAGSYADSCLRLHPALLDYNTLTTTAPYPLGQFNTEVIYDTASDGQGAAPIAASRAKIDSVLYASYTAADLRKTAFFTVAADKTVVFKGSYEGNIQRFNGLASDEAYLIRAECFARQDKVAEALQDLNTLLKARYNKSAFQPVTAGDAAEALTRILAERKKELLMRGSRWTDIKRLNKEGQGISLKRILNGTTYSLPANDLRFALPLPDDIISLSGMPQNPR